MAAFSRCRAGRRWARLTVVTILGLAACARHEAPVRPILPDAGNAGLMDFQAPACGARVYVAMGFNQKFPGQENMRVPRGDLFVNGDLVDSVSKNPEITVVDVPVGRIQVSWVPSNYDADARTHTHQDPLTLTLSEHQTAFVVLDFYDDTPQLVGFGATRAPVTVRTEAALSDERAFAGKRIVFHKTLDGPCGQVVAEAAPRAPQPAVTVPPRSIARSEPPSATEPAPAVKSIPSEQTAPAPSTPSPQVVARAPDVLPPLLPPGVKPPPPRMSVTEPAPSPAVAPSPPTPEVVAPPQAPPAKTAPAPQVETRQAVAVPTPVPQPRAQPITPAQPAPPAATPSPPLPREAQQASLEPEFLPAARYSYYTVSAPDGAPAFAMPRNDGAPLFTFTDSTELKVAGISTDRRWLKVTTPQGQTAYVSTALVTAGARFGR